MEISNNATVQMIQNIIDGTTPPAKATSADTANSATTAENAENAEQLGGVAASGYAKTTGTYSGMTVGNATDAVRLGGKGSEEYALKSEIVGGENLLINPDFRINQREKKGTISAISSDKTYIVDRWCLQYVRGAQIDVNDDYVSVSNGNLLQYIEDYKKLSNKTVTLSVQWKNLASSALRVAFIYWDSGTYTLLNSSNMRVVAGEATNLRTDSITFTIPDLSNSTAAAIRFYKDDSSSNGTYAIYWVKLEEGSAATPFVSPDYTTELLKCQRYYVNFNDTNISYPGYLLNSTTARAIITLPAAMRDTPTITLNSGISAVRVMVNGNTITPTSGTVQFAEQNQLVYSLTIPTTLSGAYPCVVRFLQHFSADAEL